MKFVFAAIFIVIIGFLVVGGYFLFKEKAIPDATQTKVNEKNNAFNLADFSDINSEFLFSAKIPKEFEMEYITNLRAINVFNPALKGNSNIEKSLMYLTFFKANKFLTLNTVTISRQDKININGREAVFYEITKKEGVPNFSGQPDWRNFTHSALDIRQNQDNPSYFYSFARNPLLSEKTFNEIIDSLVFY